MINKCDSGVADDIKKQYEKSGVDVLSVSAHTREGFSALEELIKGKCVCFAGQSAVGKSSIINSLFPDLNLETGGLSKKTDRGRHTTRHSELILLPRLNATVIDTPGFSILECIDIEPQELSKYYSEFNWQGCKFTECLHDKEPDCAVKKQLEAGEISPERYERYKAILYKLKERRETMYD